MIKAKITKVSRNISSPQVDIEVTYTDSENKDFEVKRVFTQNFSEATIEKVTQLVKDTGKEYKETLKNEDELIKNLVDQEIEIE